MKDALTLQCPQVMTSVPVPQGHLAITGYLWLEDPQQNQSWLNKSENGRRAQTQSHKYLHAPHCSGYKKAQRSLEHEAQRRLWCLWLLLSLTSLEILLICPKLEFKMSASRLDLLLHLWCSDPLEMRGEWSQPRGRSRYQRWFLHLLRDQA